MVAQRKSGGSKKKWWLKEEVVAQRISGDSIKMLNRDILNGTVEHETAEVPPPPTVYIHTYKKTYFSAKKLRRTAGQKYFGRT